jgi:hypothetical protein
MSARAQAEVRASYSPQFFCIFTQALDGEAKKAGWFVASMKDD